MSKKDLIKQKFIKDFKEFSKTLYDVASCPNGQWTVKGFIDVFKNVYTISSDTKIVSKILEIHLYPIIKTFADEIGYILEPADEQNYYPDFTFVNKEDKSIKFAVDLKSTYRRSKKRGAPTVAFTLGSHGKYFMDRSCDKNIQHPYKDYSGHFCLAVVYTQLDEIDEDHHCNPENYIIYSIDELGNVTRERTANHTEKIESLQEIKSVISDMKFYFSEKWKIASDSHGSGNTANIGSTKTEKDLADETGVFAKLGEQYFDDYWINYGKISFVRDGETTTIKNIWDYLAFKNEKDKFVLVGNGAKRKPIEHREMVKKSKKKK